MLESYGTGTGIAIGSACLVVPAIAVFAAFFAGNGDEKVVRRSAVVAGGLGLATALTCAYLSSGSVRRGILYGLVAAPAVLMIPAALDGVDSLVNGRLSEAVGL